MFVMMGVRLKSAEAGGVGGQQFGKLIPDELVSDLIQWKLIA